MAIIVTKKGVEVAAIVDKSSFAKERNLQQYIHEHPEAIPVYEIDQDKRLFVVAREFASRSGPIDAIAIDEDGDIYVVETKLYGNTDKRKVVAQALDYGASLWKHSGGTDAFLSLLDKHSLSKWGVPFREKAQAFFSLDDEQVIGMLDAIAAHLKDGDFKFVVLMDSIDEPLKDLITYVNQNSGFDIYGVELEYYSHQEYEIVIPKLYGIEAKKTVHKGAGGVDLLYTTASDLLKMAEERNTTELVETCREMQHVWEERPRLTAGGSFRYWAPQRTNGSMVFGVNASGQLANAPAGQLDVWVRSDALAKVTGVGEAAIKTRLLKDFKPFSAGMMDCIIRLKTKADALQLTTALKEIASGATQQATAA